MTSKYCLRGDLFYQVPLVLEVAHSCYCRSMNRRPSSMSDPEVYGLSSSVTVFSFFFHTPLPLTNLSLLSLFLSHQVCWSEWSCVMASTSPVTSVTSLSVATSTPALRRCSSTSVASTTSTPWRERSMPTRWMKFRTTRCCARYSGTQSVKQTALQWQCIQCVTIVTEVWYSWGSTHRIIVMY